MHCDLQLQHHVILVERRNSLRYQVVYLLVGVAHLEELKGLHNGVDIVLCDVQGLRVHVPHDAVYDFFANRFGVFVLVQTERGLLDPVLRLK